MGRMKQTAGFQGSPRSKVRYGVAKVKLGIYVQQQKLLRKKYSMQKRQSKISCSLSFSLSYYIIVIRL